MHTVSTVKKRPQADTVTADVWNRRNRDALVKAEEDTMAILIILPTGSNWIKKDLSFMATFASSFCQTASPGIFYYIHIGYDADHVLHTQEHINMFSTYFNDFMVKNCQKRLVQVSWELLPCHLPSGETAAITNDQRICWNTLAFMAQIKKISYYAQVSSRTDFRLWPLWSTYGVSSLKENRLKNIGVVVGQGDEHTDGITMVHKTHMDIFLDFIPDIITACHQHQQWFIEVYRRVKSVKLLDDNVLAIINSCKRNLTEPMLSAVDKWALYLTAYQNPASKLVRNVISYGMGSDAQSDVKPIIQNVMILNRLLPHWSSRVTIDDRYSTVTHNDLITMKRLGVDVVFVKYADVLLPEVRAYDVINDSRVSKFITMPYAFHISPEMVQEIRRWEASPFSYIVFNIRNQSVPTERQIPVIGAVKKQWDDNNFVLTQEIPKHNTPLFQYYGTLDDVAVFTDSLFDKVLSTLEDNVYEGACEICQYVGKRGKKLRPKSNVS